MLRRMQHPPVTVTVMAADPWARRGLVFIPAGRAGIEVRDELEVARVGRMGLVQTDAAISRGGPTRSPRTSSRTSRTEPSK
jgi:hypothetical protein